MKNNYILYGSLALNVVLGLVLVLAIFTSTFDFMMFEKSLSSSICNIVKTQNASEYTGFIQRVCEEK